MAGARAVVKEASAAEIVEALSEGAAIEVQAGSTRQPAGPQVYVVQVRVGAGWLVGEVGEEVTLPEPGIALWEDVCSVTVPARSKRKTIIERALNSEEGRQLTLPVILRILDADAAREFPVGLKPRDPELVIG